MAASAQSIHIRVLVASTGVCYNIALHPSELTVANIRRHLAAAVPQSDQILLLGPPYKVPKDVTLQNEAVLNSLRLGDQEDNPESGDVNSNNNNTQQQQQQRRSILSTTERTGARRLFLFSKQALSESAPDPPPCQLQPMMLNLPTEPGPSPLKMAIDSSATDPGSASQSSPATAISPLHQALEVYERRFMLNLDRGRALADGAELRLRACKSCVLEQAVMARALRAAVSNLSDHFNGAARTRTEFTATFQAKTSAHASLLHRFDSLLQNLANIPLHPALVSVARASGRVMETLLDTVPVERERAWANQCSKSHQRLLTLFSELDTAFGQMGTTASREEEARQDSLAEDAIKSLWSEVEGAAKQICDVQAQRLERLTSDHGEVVKVVMNAISHGRGDTSSDGGSAQAAFTTLEEMSKASVDILPSMESDDMVLMQLMQRVADAKTEAMKRMKRRLREVSVSQSSIQRVLSSMTVLRDALAQQCENIIHLEHVAELQVSYLDFLSELRRRRAYGKAVTSSSTAMIERLASMREDEVKAREKFLRGPGRHLMPPFFEIFAPTLATPPPLFTPQLPAMIELDTMPDVGPADHPTQVGGSSSDAPMQENTPKPGDISNASSLTADSQQQQASMDKISSSGGEEADASMVVASTSQQTGFNTSRIIDTVSENKESEEDQLIVSADEASGNDLIVGPSDQAGAAADAERKTLAYENAVLRQALERMGGKTPRSYIDEAREKDKQQQQSAEEHGQQQGGVTAESISQIAALQKELEEAKAQARVATEALENSKKQNDKISHSSFEVGDIGLFMPTGRQVSTSGRRKGRTYLAFHTNCPHRYLSIDNIEGNPDFVLGRIVYQEELIAGEVGTDANPFGLHIGTKFWILTVEQLHLPQSPSP